MIMSVNFNKQKKIEDTLKKLFQISGRNYLFQELHLRFVK